MSVKIEIVDGELRIALPLPTDTCPRCGTVFTQILRPHISRITAEQARSLYIHDLIESPEAWAKGRWLYPPDGDSIRVCAPCAEPVAEIERIAMNATRAATAQLLAQKP